MGLRAEWLAILLVWLGILACQSTPGRVEETRFLLGTYVRICLYDQNQARARAGLERAFTAMAQVETLASVFLPEGELFKLNRSGKTRVSPELHKLLARSLELARISDGAFDPTVYPLMALWGFYEGRGRVPEPSQIEEALRRVDYRRIELLEGDSVRLEGGCQVDLGGIAVGYAIDRAVEVLQVAGVPAGLVDAGGDIRVFGNRRFRIGVKHPREPGVIWTFELRDRAVATSGDYEKYFESSGTRWHHLLDPKLGYPAQGCASVTIIAPDATWADALATGVFILGPDKGVRLIDSLPNCECLIIAEGDDGRVLLTRSKGFP